MYVCVCLQMGGCLMGRICRQERDVGIGNLINGVNPLACESLQYGLKGVIHMVEIFAKNPCDALHSLPTLECKETSKIFDELGSVS